MKRLPIDLELVRIALEDRDGRWFLDRETGEVRRDESERSIAIPYQGSEAGYRDMAEFVDSIDDNRMRALLTAAIDGAFRGFEDVLCEHPGERERWFAFHKARGSRRALRWLESEGIEPEPPGN